jgi:hypothetical protein
MVKMNELILISNIVLVAFTGIYVFLTYRLMKESRKNNKNNLDFYKEQLRLSTIPLISINIPKQKSVKEVNILIENIGQLPAFNIDVWIISEVHNEDFPKKKLVKLIKDKGHRDIVKYIDIKRFADDQFYSLYDRGVYAILPGSYRINLNSKFAFDPYSIDLLLQYQDHAGNNYYQRYCLSRIKEKNNQLIIDDITPNSLKTHPRFEFEPVESEEIRKSIPEDIKYIYELMRSGVYLGILGEDKVTSVENKWELEKIS